MEQYLGIDVGGTNVKFGIVDKSGTILRKEKHATDKLRAGGNFIEFFTNTIGTYLKEHPQIKRVGIAVPGLISKDRLSTIFMANIPEFNNIPLVTILQTKYPDSTFFLENDANAAALGELYFSAKKMPQNFLFMTLGTGLGSAAIINGNIFKGGHGNAMEGGHVITANGKTAEENMGKEAILNKTLKKIKKGKDTSLSVKNLTAKEIVNAAIKKDPVALEVLEKVGTVLGEALVSTIRILDIKDVYVGGGVSKAFKIVKKKMKKVLKKRLPDYYLDDLNIKLASLKNDAGIIGAAALCFKED